MFNFSQEHILIYLAGVNLLTFLVFWQDKRSSRRGGWRVSENTLLVFCLIGGSLGGLIASKKLRHKTSKGSFKYRMYLIILLQLLAAGYFAYQHYYFQIVWLYLSNFSLFS